MIRKTRNALLILVALTFTACPMLTISHYDTFPQDTFDRANQHIAKLQARNPDRAGEATEIHLLVFDGDEGQLIKMTMPLTVVEWGVDVAKYNVHDDSIENQLNPLDHMNPEDLRKLGPGLLVHVEDADDDTHVLIWLE